MNRTATFIQWACLVLGIVWFGFSFVDDGPNTAFVISMIFLAASMVIGAIGAQRS